MAVFTTLSRTQIESVISSYNCGELLDFSGIEEGSENTNYICETTIGKYVLTLFEARSNPAHIQPQITFIKNLYKGDVPVPSILLNENKNVLHEVEGKGAILQTFLFGKSVTLATEKQCHSSGASLAKMHLVGEKSKINIPNSLGINNLLNMAKEIQEKQVTPDLEEIINFLKEYKPPANLAIGAVHTDYFKNNVFFEGDKVSGIFDFWFACDEVLIYDLAVSLNVWGFDEGTYKPKLFDAFLAGYESIRPLTDDEKKYLPQELQRSAARFYLTRLYDKVMTTKNMENMPPQTWFKRFAFHKT